MWDQPFLLYAINPSNSISDKWIYPQSISRLPADSKYACLIVKGGYIAEIAVPVSYLNKNNEQNWMSVEKLSRMKYAG